MEIGKENRDIFFTDRKGRRNTECLSWGIDKERVLKGRTGIESLGLCTSSHAFYHYGERLTGPTMKLVTNWNLTSTLYSGEH
ncbi:hypothetical protein ACSBR1_043107 [Camellia fascicularis]